MAQVKESYISTINVKLVNDIAHICVNNKHMYCCKKHHTEVTVNKLCLHILKPDIHLVLLSKKLFIRQTVFMYLCVCTAGNVATGIQQLSPVKYFSYSAVL